MKCVIRTYTGREVNPLDLQPEDICLEDIAHALANVNRFAGHVKRPISVAQHSVYVSRLCAGTPYELQGLLHDASEYVLGDVTKWLKGTSTMAAYREAEERTQACIYEHFGCPLETHDYVERADRIMVRYEGLQGFGKRFVIDHPNYPPLTPQEIAAVGPWGFWSWRQAEQGFLDAFRLLQDRPPAVQNGARRNAAGAEGRGPLG